MCLSMHLGAVLNVSHCNIYVGGGGGIAEGNHPPLLKALRCLMKIRGINLHQCEAFTEH